jgi:hypothetical protein
MSFEKLHQKDMSYDVYDPRKEWEYFDFPIEVSNLKFEMNFHQLSGSTCSIKISRDENFKLKATISGHTLNSKALDEDKKEEGPGNFAALDSIIGFDTENKFTYILTNCFIGSYTLKGTYFENLGMPFTAALHFDSFSRKPRNLQPDNNLPIVHNEWFVSASLNFFYPGNTRRFFRDIFHKNRQGFDEEIGSEKISPISYSRDYFTINTADIKCIVSEVPKEFKLPWAECFCFEYRPGFGLETSKSLKKSLEFFLGFLFGTEMIKIGSTTFAGEEIICQEAYSPSGGDIVHFCQNGSKPPIQFNEQYEWGKVQHLVDKYFPTYLKIGKELDLEGILWRFFQAKTVPVGVNLPILSSALEKLARNYLKAHSEVKLDYIDEADFTTLIAAEIELIKNKLGGIENADIIVNKVKGAYRRGDNERLNLFFNLIDLPINDLEKKALKARNSMAHGGSDAKTMEKAKKLILHTRVYETLFHRVFLRVLGYDDYYIDYYLSGRKIRKITTPTGPNT